MTEKLNKVMEWLRHGAAYESEECSRIYKQYGNCLTLTSMCETRYSVAAHTYLVACKYAQLSPMHAPGF